jgi:hypothetical protein
MAEFVKKDAVSAALPTGVGKVFGDLVPPSGSFKLPSGRPHRVMPNAPSGEVADGEQWEAFTAQLRAEDRANAAFEAGRGSQAARRPSKVAG